MIVASPVARAFRYPFSSIVAIASSLLSHVTLRFSTLIGRMLARSMILSPTAISSVGSSNSIASTGTSSTFFCNSIQIAQLASKSLVRYQLLPRSVEIRPPLPVTWHP